MVMILNELQWISRNAVVQKRYCENTAKFTEKHLYQDLYFNDVGGSRSEKIQWEAQIVLLRYILLCRRQ